MQGGKETEQHASKDRYRGGEEQNFSINRQVLEERHQVELRVGYASNEQIDSPVGDHQSGSAAERRKQHAFGHELTYQRCAISSQSHSHGYLFVTPRRANHQQVGHICAGDQQHEGDRHEQRD